MYLLKTVVGQQAFKVRSPQFSPRQRSAFIIFDGKKTIDEVLQATSGLGVTPSDIDQMIELGFLAQSQETVNQTEVPQTISFTPFSAMVDLQEAQARYSRAYPVATQITAKLGLRGFRLNLAVEAAGSYSQLMALFPQIKEAVGEQNARDLEQALAGGQLNVEKK